MAITDFYKGTTKKFSVTVEYNGTPADIHADTVRFMLKENPTDTDVLAKINVTADVTAGSSGIASFTLASSDTNLSAKTYYYEIDWTKYNGEFYTLELGQVAIRDRITGL